MKSLPSMVIPKHYSFDERVAIAKVGGELHLRVLRIVPPDKPPTNPIMITFPPANPGGGK
jgi:hypothetical protein